MQHGQLPQYLPYGDGSLPFASGDRFRWDVLDAPGERAPSERMPGKRTPSKSSPGAASPGDGATGRAGGPERAAAAAALISRALDHPIGSPPLEAFGGIDGEVVIAVPDITRSSGAGQVVPALLERLEGAGADPGRIRFLVGTGIHRPCTAGEAAAIVGPEASGTYEVMNHRADDERLCVHVGDSSAGTPIRLNRRLVEADLKILVGAIGLHYFAGFTGGRKMVLPGLAHRDTIFANHLKVLGGTDGIRDPAVSTARLAGNPVHEEMAEAAEMAGAGFIVNTVMDGGAVREVFAGHWREAHLAGCERVRRRSTVHVAEQRRLVVVSCGGHPKDINMIQAHKAMEHAGAALADGGVMVLLARCGEGMGHPDFFPWFRWRGDLDEMADRLRRDYQVYGQTALSLSVKASRFRAALISDLPGDQVEAMGMRPFPSVGRALEWAAELLPAGTAGYVIPHGASVLPVAGGGRTRPADG